MMYDEMRTPMSTAHYFDPIMFEWANEELWVDVNATVGNLLTLESLAEGVVDV